MSSKKLYSHIVYIKIWANPKFSTFCTFMKCLRSNTLIYYPGVGWLCWLFGYFSTLTNHNYFIRDIRKLIIIPHWGDLHAWKKSCKEFIIFCFWICWKFWRKVAKFPTIEVPLSTKQSFKMGEKFFQITSYEKNTLLII